MQKEELEDKGLTSELSNKNVHEVPLEEKKKIESWLSQPLETLKILENSKNVQVANDIEIVNVNVISEGTVGIIEGEIFSKSSSVADEKPNMNIEENQLNAKEESSGLQEEKVDMTTDKNIIVKASYGQNAGLTQTPEWTESLSMDIEKISEVTKKEENMNYILLSKITSTEQEFGETSLKGEDKKSKIAFSSVCMVETGQAHKGIDEKDKGVEILSTKDVCMPKETACPDHQTEEESESSDGAKYEPIGLLVTAPIEETSSAKSGPELGGNLEETSSTACEGGSQEMAELNEKIKDVNMNKDGVQSNKLQSSLAKEIEDLSSQKVGRLETSKEESETRIKNIVKESQNEEDNKNEILQNIATTGKDDENHRAKPDVLFTDPKESIRGESENLTPTEALTIERKHERVLVVAGDGNTLAKKQDKTETSKHEEHLEQSFMQKTEPTKENLGSSSNAASAEIETIAPDEYAETITKIEEQKPVGDPEEILGERREEETIMGDIISEKEIPEEKNLSRIDVEETIRGAESKISNKNGNDLHVVHLSIEETAQVGSVSGDQVNEAFAVLEEDEKHVNETNEANKNPKSTILEDTFTVVAINIDVSLARSEMYNAEETIIEKHCELNSKDNLRGETKTKEKDFDTNFQKATGDDYEKSTIEEDVPVKYSSPLYGTGEEEYHHDQEDKNRPIGSKEASPELDSVDQSQRMTDKTKDITDQIIKEEFSLNYINNSIKCPSQVYKDPEIAGTEEDTENETNNEDHTVADHSPESTGNNTTKCSQENETEEKKHQAEMEELETIEREGIQKQLLAEENRVQDRSTVSTGEELDNESPKEDVMIKKTSKEEFLEMLQTADGSANIGIGIQATEEDGKAKDNFATSDGEETKNECSYVEGEQKEPDTAVPQVTERVAHREIIKDQVTREEICTEELPLKPVVDETADEVTDLDLRPIQSRQGTVLNNNTGMLKSEVAELNPELEASPMTKALEEEIEKPMDVDTSFDDISEQNLQASSTQSQEEDNLGKPEESETKGEASNKSKTLDAKAESPIVAEKTEEDENKDESTIPGKDTIMGSTVTVKESIYDDAQDEDQELSPPCELKNDKNISEADVEQLLKTEKTKEVANSSVIGISKTSEEKSSDIELEKEKYEFVMAVNEASSNVEECGKCINTDVAIPEHGDSVKSKGSSKESAEIEKASAEFEEEVYSHGSEASNSSISTTTETKIETDEHGKKLGSSPESMTEDKNNRRFPETNQTSPEEESCDDVNGIIDSTKEEVSGQHIQEGKEKMSKEMEPERETKKEFNEIEDMILTAKVPIEIERPVVTEIIEAHTTKEESSSEEPVAEETVNKVANLELTPIHNLEATVSSDNTEMVKSNVAKNLNQESEASFITKALEEETEKPLEVSSPTEVSEEKIKEEKIEDAQNCDDKTDTAPTMATDVTNRGVQLNDQPVKALDTSSDTPRLARTKTTDPCQQDAEVDSMKLEEISGMMSELPTRNHEKADGAEAKENKISSVISKNTDWGKKEIHETDTSLSVRQTDKHENEIQISEAPKALFESINQGVEAAGDDKITSLGHVKLNDKLANAFDYSSDAKSIEKTEISETSQQDTEVENKKLEENSSTVSQFPIHENLENDNESMTVEKSHANDVEIEEIDIPNAAPGSENQAVQELHEASTSLTTGDTDTTKTEKHIRQVPDLVSEPTNQDVETHANDVEVEEINIPCAAPESENQAFQEFPEGCTSLNMGDTNTNETEKHIRQVPDSLSEPINQDVEAAKDDEIPHGQTLQTEKIEQLQVPSPNLLSEEKDHETTTAVKKREDGSTKKDETEVGSLMLDENSGTAYQLTMIECDISNNVIAEQSDAEEVAVKETKILDTVSESKSQGLKEIHMVDMVSPSNEDSHEIGTIAPSENAEQTTNIKEDEHVGSTETVTTDVINKETAEEKNLSKHDLDEMEIPKKNVNYLNVIHPHVEETVQSGGENQDESGYHEAFEITKEEEKTHTETHGASKIIESTSLEHMSTEGKLAMEVTSTSDTDVKLEKDCEVNSEDKLKDINTEENIKEETLERENTSHTDLQIAIKFEALKNGKNLDGRAKTPLVAKKTKEDITEDKDDSTNPEKDTNVEPTVIENECINVNVWDEEEQEFYAHGEPKNDKGISESDAEILKGKSKEMADSSAVGKLKNSEEAKSSDVELEKEKYEYVNVVNKSFEECGKCTGTTSEAILELEDSVNSDGSSKESIEVERAPVEFEEKVHTHGREDSRNTSTSTPTETTIKTDEHGEKLTSFPKFVADEKSKRRFPLTNQTSNEEESCDDVNQITDSTKEEISGQDIQEGKKKMNKEMEPEIETKKELNEIQDTFLTAEVPAEIERAVETEITKHQSTKEPHVMPIADETVNEVANQDLTSIQNLEATISNNNTEMVRSNVAKDLNQESEASPTTNALEEETEKPAEVSSSPAEVIEENIMEDNIKDAQNFDDEADNAPTMDIILTNTGGVQLNDQTLKAYTTISYAPGLARTKTVDPSQQDAEVDSMKVEEISSMISQLPAQEHEKADVAEAKEIEILSEISKYKDQGKKEIHETDAGLSVGEADTNENDKHIIEVPEVFSESMGETDAKETEKQTRQVLESLSETIDQDVESVRDDETTPGQTLQTKKIEEQLQVPFPNLLSKGDSETTTTVEETEHWSTKDNTEVGNLMLEENSGILYQLPITDCDGANNAIVEKSDEVAAKETKTLDTLFESEGQGFKQTHMVDLANPTNVGSEGIETTSPNDYVEMTTNIEEKRHVGRTETITTDDINEDYPETKNLSKLDLEEMTRSADVEIPINGNDLCVAPPPVEETVQLGGENQDEVSASELGDHETFGVAKEEEKHGTERYEAKSPMSTTLEHMSTEGARATEVTSTSEMDVKLENGCKVDLQEELKETNAEEHIKEETEQKDKASDTDFQIAMKSDDNEKRTIEEDVPVIDSNLSCTGEEEYYHDQKDTNRPNSSKEASPELASEDQSSTTSSITKNTNDKIRNKEAIQLYKDPKISDIGEDLTEGEEIKHNKQSVTDYSSESTGKHTTKCSDKEEEDREPTTVVLETNHGGQDAAEHIIINSVRYQPTEPFMEKPVQKSSQDDKASEGYRTAIKSTTTEESAITDPYLSSVGEEKLEESIKEDKRDSIISEKEVGNSNKYMEQTFDATCSIEERSLEDEAETNGGLDSQSITGSSKEEIAQKDRNLHHVEKSKLVPMLSKKEIKEEILEKADSKVAVIAEETRLTQVEAEYVTQIDSFNQVSEEKGSAITETSESGSNSKDIAAEPEETSSLGENDMKIQTAEKHGTDEASEKTELDGKNETCHTLSKTDDEKEQNLGTVETSMDDRSEQNLQASSWEEHNFMTPEASEITSDVPKNDNKLYGKAEHEKADNESITVAKSYVEVEETKIYKAVLESEDQGENEIQETSKALSVGKNATNQSSEIENQIIKIPEALSKPINQGVEVARDDETMPGQTLQNQKIEETELTSKEEAEQTGAAETVEVEVDEAKTNEEEGDEHIKVDLGSDAPVNIEASSEIDVKIAHKKSHKILSGVGSKVKHSLAKVKKVITGKSPHGKPSSPK